MLNHHALLLAPLDGITDSVYRRTILELYPEWDWVFTAFLRVPSVGVLPVKRIREHIGIDAPLDKTALQLLASERSSIEDTVEKADTLGVRWIDLNAGCPAQTVVAHGGGAHLLRDLTLFRKLVQRIRHHYSGFFSVKTRIGFSDDTPFSDVLAMLKDEGVDALTLHARTRQEVYSGAGHWDYISRAVQTLSIPVIGNGALWTREDVGRMENQTQCHATMIARGALQHPWFPKKKWPASNEEKRQEIIRYFTTFAEHLSTSPLPAEKQLSRMKSLCVHVFDEIENGQTTRSTLLHARTQNDFLRGLHQCENLFNRK